MAPLIQVPPGKHLQCPPGSWRGDSLPRQAWAADPRATSLLSPWESWNQAWAVFLWFKLAKRRCWVLLSRTEGQAGAQSPLRAPWLPLWPRLRSLWQPQCWRTKPGRQEAARCKLSLGTRLDHTHRGPSPGQSLGCLTAAEEQGGLAGWGSSREAQRHALKVWEAGEQPCWSLAQQPGGATAASESWDQRLDQGDKPHPKAFQSPSTKLSPKSSFWAGCS